MLSFCKVVSLSFALIVLTACGEGDALLSFDDSPSETGLTIDDFRANVVAIAGEGAEDCGEADVGEGADQNECVAFSFGQEIPSFAIYNEDSSDSIEANAFAVNSEGRVFQLFFDSDPSGGGSEVNGVISIRECVVPRLSGVVDNPEVALFVCDAFQ